MESVVNPTFALPYGGYRMIGDADSDYQWWSMLQPGATGVGLHIAYHATPQCCFGGGGASYRSIWTPEHELWLYPTLIQYRSIIDPETHIAASDVARQFELSDIVGPYVGVEDIITSPVDYRWVLDHVIHGDNDDMWYEIDGRDYSVGQIGGLVPVWEIVPIHESLVDLAADGINRLAQIDAHIMDRCYCDLEDYDNSNHRPDLTEPGADPCVFTVGMNSCSCGMHPTLQQVYEAFIEATPDHGMFFEHPMDKVWELGKYQHMQGWQRLYEQSRELSLTEEERKCFTSYLQHYSPYSPHSGPEAQVTRHLLNSTSSETRQAS